MPVVIPLSQGKESIVDDTDSHLSGWKWSFHSAGYAVRTVFGKGRLMFMHQAILGHQIRGMQIDHINGNGLDNRRDNLRIVTHRENSQNLKRHRLGHLVGANKHISRYKNKSYVSWNSVITVDGKRKHLGCFKSEMEAHIAYEKALKKINGGENGKRNRNT